MGGVTDTQTSGDTYSLTQNSQSTSQLNDSSAMNDGSLELTSLLSQTGGDSAQRSDLHTITDHNDQRVNSYGVVSDTTQDSSLSQSGSDSYTLRESAQAPVNPHLAGSIDPLTGPWTLLSYNLQGGGGQTASQLQDYSQHWENFQAGYYEYGDAAASQSKSDSLSYSFNQSGQFDPLAGWVDDGLNINEAGQEGFTFTHSASKTHVDTSLLGNLWNGLVNGLASTLPVNPLQIIQQLQGLLGSAPLNYDPTPHASASLSGSDSFTYTQTGPALFPNLMELQRQGSDSYSMAGTSVNASGLSTVYGPRTGNDSYTVTQTQQPQGNSEVGSQSGTASLGWSWAPTYIQLSSNTWQTTDADGGAETTAFPDVPGGGPPDTFNNGGGSPASASTTALTVVGAGNPSVFSGLTAQDLVSSGLVLWGSNPDTLLSGDAGGAAGLVTNAAFKALQGAGTAALALGADQLAAARGVLEAVQTAWQQGAGTVLSAMLARFTSELLNYLLPGKCAGIP